MIVRQIAIYLLLLCFTAVITVKAYFYFREHMIVYHQAEYFYKQKKYPAAIDNYYLAMQKGVYNRVLVFHLGDALTAEKKFPEAIELYREYLTDHENDETARHRLALVLSYAGRFDESLKEENQLLRENETTPH